MGYPKFHGITLAANSAIENLHVERLAADPLPIAAGRIWYNLTQKALKFSSLDAGGAVVIGTVATAEDAAAAIAALQAGIDAEVAARGVAVTAEADARIAAVAVLTQAVADEAAARAAAITTEAAARVAGDADEATARVAADAVAAATAADQTSTETTARLAGDAALGGRVDAVQAELNVTQASAGFEVDGTYVAPLNTTYLGTTTSLKTADVALDVALTAEVATRTGAVASLASGLANEAQTRADADTALQTQLEAFVSAAVGSNAIADQVEAAARIAADTAIKTELDLTQATIGTAADGSLIPITGTNYLDAVTTVFGGAFVLDTEVKRVSDAVAGEVSARTAADVTINAALQTEITNRTAADADQQTELNTIEAGAGLETDGTYAAPTGSNYLNVATSLKDADFKLDAALKAVSSQVNVLTTASTDAVAGVQAAVDAEAARALAAEGTEATARIAGDAAGATALAAEATRATGIEAGLQTALDAEVAARGVAVAAANAATAAEVVRASGIEASLQTQVTAEAGRATAAEGVVTAAVATELARALAAEAALEAEILALEAAAGAGSEALKASLNAGRFTFTSASAALVHVVAHNLGTPFLNVTVMVEGADGVFRNDIVPVEEIDGGTNSFRVSLTEARRIRVAVQSVTPLV